MKAVPFAKIIPAVAMVALTACQALTPSLPIGMASVVTQSSYTHHQNEQRILPENIKELSLDYCLRTALTNNPDYQSTFSSISAAWARYYQSLSAYAPQVTLNTGYNGGAVNARHNEGMGQDFNQISMGVSAQWLIFNGLVREMNMLAAKEGAKSAELTNQNARRILIRAVGVAYNNILLAREQIRIVNENRTFNERLLKEAQAKYDAGSAAVSEVLNFQVRLMDTENSLIQARAVEEGYRYVLAQLMGLTTVEIPSVIAFPSIMDANKFTYILMDVENYLDAALGNRPDLKAYRTALQAATYQLYAKYGAYSPSVYASAGFTGASRTGAQYKTGYNASLLSRTGEPSWGINATWTIFDGFYRWNAVREAQANVETQHYAVASAWIMVIAEVRQAHLNYNMYEQLLQVYRQKLELVKKTRDLVVEEYNAGRATIVRVNEAQRDVVEAESNVASSCTNLLNARIQLEAATGISQ